MEVMKKIGYLFMIVIESISLLATIVIPFTYPVIFADIWPMLLCITIGVPLLAFICLGIEFRNCIVAQKTPLPTSENAEGAEALTPEEDRTGTESPDQTIQAKGHESVPEGATTIDEDKPIHEAEKCLEHQWSIGMYQRFNDKWDELFNNLKRPLTPEAKGQISVLLWEISSQTINFLKESNSDLNKVRYHADGVRMITENLPVDDIKFEKFYKDPTTVPVNVIAIYEWLEEQGVTIDTTAFGYQLKFQQS